MDVTVVLPSLQRLHMSNNKTHGTYVLNVPSLKYLKCSGMASSNLLQIKNMPELVTAHFIFCGTHKFLKALTSVRRLKLWITPPQGRVVGSTYLYAPRISQNYDFSNSLINSGRKIPTGWKLPSSVPECLLHSLEAFEWFGYRGRHGDKEMAAYVLENATCLKTATFYPKSTHLGKRNRMIELASKLFD
ncbi:unnamed protein product [Brassica rapa]|uniref:FBD domain-containing protein n=1 Tax=Brassica campestris TaxID=3711 RepID=A0A8D9GP66_BRACM|nr:unnamed protein product [Brassica rapa]